MPIEHLVGGLEQHFLGQGAWAGAEVEDAWHELSILTVGFEKNGGQAWRLQPGRTQPGTFSRWVLLTHQYSIVIRSPAATGFHTNCASIGQSLSI